MGLFSHFFKKNKDPYSNDLISIYENLHWYYRSFIKDKEITEENETALDNIASFIVFDYDNLSFEKKMDVNRLMYIYSQTLNIIFSAYKDEAKGIYESDNFFIIANEKFDELYSSIVETIYDLDKKQIEDLNLSYKKLNQIKNYYNDEKLSNEFSISKDIK